MMSEEDTRADERARWARVFQTWLTASEKGTDDRFVGSAPEDVLAACVEALKANREGSSES
ncbi:MAG TPA: hypothetical protein VGI39_04850 [Polyangiaceae bacterium]|jgi:hypothetical protein